MTYEDKFFAEEFEKLKIHSDNTEKYISEMVNRAILLVIERRKLKTDELNNEKIMSLLNYSKWLLNELYEDYINRSESKNKNIEDIQYIGCGFKSITLRVGDNILKIGKHNYKIKETNLDTKHKIPTYIRESYEIGEQNYLTIEVAPYVDVKNITLEEVYKVYSNIRNLGYIWNDPKEDNVGRIINVQGCKIGDKIYSSKYQYEKGELVILDLEDIAYVGEETSDIILEEIATMSYNSKVYIFETRYMEEKKLEKQGSKK